MTLRDSLGVPMEPPEEKEILKDIYGDPIYLNSTIYINKDGLLLEENLERYTNEYVEELTAGEANEELREAMLPRKLYSLGSLIMAMQNFSTYSLREERT